MRLSTGDLVSVLPAMGGDVDLVNRPPGPSLDHDDVGDPPKVIGALRLRDVGLVVSLDRSDGRCAYVIGPRGAGWAFGAYLRVVSPYATIKRA
jgi:hypothetical protein